ncbi:MAG: hypothetical protein KDI44_11670 [Thiothrix sp.]|nr:hypothetical protein [Thiothrix sp.]
MEQWYGCSLGDAMLAGEVLEQIRTATDRLLARAGNPPEMAVFMRHESEGRLHCELKVYFSPAAVAVARAFAARPCHQPASSGLGLVAGTEAAWARLFGAFGSAIQHSAS